MWRRRSIPPSAKRSAPMWRSGARRSAREAWSHGDPTMKITAIRATPINLPIEAPYLWSFGWLPGSSRTVVEVETDEGLTGIGEAASYTAVDLINRAIAPRLIGRDPIDIAGAELLCLPSWKGVASSIDFGLIRAFAAVETALWDIRGKA